MNYKNLKIESSTCLECGAQLTGRKDRKFCCINCKNVYNNRRLKIINDYRRGVISQLSRNYEILEMVLNFGKTSISLDEIVRLEFNPNFVTSQKIGRGRHKECFCYDLCYNQSESKIFNLRRISFNEQKSVPFPVPNNHR